MRWIAIFLLLAGMTGARAVPVQASASTAVANSPDKPSVYVGGQVQKPGHYPWFHGMTVVDAINAAGGRTVSSGYQIQISRTDGTRIRLHADTFPYGLARPPPVDAGHCVLMPAQ